MRSHPLALVLAAICGSAISGTAVGAEEAGAESRPDDSQSTSTDLTEEQQALLAESVAARAKLSDPAFERFVRLEDIAAAYMSLEVSELIDAALQLAEGERVLLRPHHSGIKARDLLDVAARAAVKDRQPVAFDRLLRAAQQLELNDLLVSVEAAQKLAAQPRSTKIDLHVHDWILSTIEHAELLGDTPTMDELIKELPEDLSAEQRQLLAARVRDAKTFIATARPESPLDKLSAPSRLAPYVFTFSAYPGSTIPQRTIRMTYAVGYYPPPVSLWISSSNPSVIKIDTHIPGPTTNAVFAKTEGVASKTSVKLRARVHFGRPRQFVDKYRYITVYPQWPK